MYAYKPNNELQENDRCTIEGTMDGIYTYKVVSGEGITIPKLSAE